MNKRTVLSPDLYFSYGQFMIYDSAVALPGCAWTDKHTAQGFARRESAVSFSTLLEFGCATVTVMRGQYLPSTEYERVVAVPFSVKSAKINIEGPEEFDVERSVQLDPGRYRLTAAQFVLGDEEERIDLFFEPCNERLERSEILIVDEGLHPSDPLVETADVAQL
jgi:hypothetical protein